MIRITHIFSRTAVILALGTLSLVPFVASAAFSPATTVLTTEGQNPYATFQSHNQKIVENKYGIFVTYIRGSNNPSVDVSKFTWHLMRSTNGGKSFSQIYSGSASYPPVLETDSSGNIYLVESSTADLSDAYLLRFSPFDNFANPRKTVLPKGGAYKFAAVIDEARSQLYFAGATTNSSFPVPVMRFYIVGFDGVVKSNSVLTKPGISTADAHYPLLYLDTSGDLYMAWSTVRPKEYTYWSIHVIRSRNGGLAWENLEKTPLSTPIVADESGQTTRINLDDEFAPPGTWASTWLSSFIVKNGKAHFAYRALTEPARQHYVRYDIKTGKKDKDIFPTWKGEKVSIENLDGFFATTPEADSPLYYISAQKNSPQIAGLYSLDNGDTWKDYALGDPLPTPPPSSRLPGTLSVSQAAPAYPAAYAVDGNPSTQWIANLTPTTDNNNAWVILDLGAVYMVDTLKWKGGMWQPYPAQSPGDYTIEVAQQDGQNWAKIATRTNPVGVIDGNETIGMNARYIRLQTTKVNEGSGWALSFSEIWAEGTKPSSFLYSIGGSRMLASDGSVLGSYTEITPGAPNSTARFMKIPPIKSPTPAPVICGTVNMKTVGADQGNNYVTYTFPSGGDTLDALQNSTLTLYENGKLLGPAHTSIVDLRSLGGGRYLHWQSSLYFSSSDNTDPRTNGRTYAYGGVCKPPPGPLPVMCGAIDPKRVYLDAGSGYLVHGIAPGGDTAEAGNISKLALYENGKLLGPANTLHADIRTKGMGRYSHWYKNLFFSASDNTDPRTNGRTYTYSGVCDSASTSAFSSSPSVAAASEQKGPTGINLMAAVGAIAAAPFEIAIGALAKIFLALGIY